MGQSAPIDIVAICPQHAAMSEATKFQIRMPSELHQQLSDAAKKNDRSLNSELVARLASTFGANDLALRVAALEAQVAQLLKKGK
jgi:hypothetical protein